MNNFYYFSYFLATFHDTSNFSFHDTWKGQTPLVDHAICNTYAQYDKDTLKLTVNQFFRSIATDQVGHKRDLSCRIVE